MAAGFIEDKDGVNVPGIVLGAGTGNGDNRGYITKVPGGLAIYYIGDKAAGEISFLKLAKDAAYLNNSKFATVNPSTNKIADSLIESAGNWNTKLSEYQTKTILEDPSKAWKIPQANLSTTVSEKIDWGTQAYGYFDMYGKLQDSRISSSNYWNAVENIIKGDINLLSPLPEYVTLTDLGIRAVDTADSSRYAIFQPGGLFVNNGAIQVKNRLGNTIMDGFGVAAEHITGFYITGKIIRSAASGQRSEFL